MSAAAKILLVEDDPKLAEGVCDALSRAGYAVTWVADGSQAAFCDPAAFELIVLDLMLPGVHGFDLLAQWRERSDVPVIILTARADPHDKIRGLDLGGDDYMTKPFWPGELLARIKARLRRPQLERGDGLVAGPLHINSAMRRAFVEGRELELTPVEFDILAVLVARPEQAISRAHLVERALDPERDGTERTLDVHVSRIRKKLGAHAVHLATVWGVGYRWLRDARASS